MDLRKLKEEQLKLSGKVITRDDFKKTELIAGCEQAAVENKIVSAIAVCDKEMNLIEQKTAVVEAKVPYTQGFLFYREGPAVIEAFSRLERKPDVLLVSGHGITHPLRIGMASHLGIILDIPTIGIAKKLLCGTIDKEGKIEVNKEIRGAELITKEHANPLFISPGHRISLQTAMHIARDSIKPPHKMPEPMHIARRIAKNERNKLAVTD